MRFNSTEAVRDVDIDVERGEAVALMGPSGSGKSSLLKCLAGVLPPSAGTVALDGTPIYDLSDQARAEVRRRRFGFVFQFGLLVPELTLEENVGLPLLLERRPRREVLLLARTLLDELGVGHLAGRLPEQVSGGEAQRAALARAVIGRPDVVFADEPTGALDSKNGEQVLRLLLDSADRRGAAVLLVTHDDRIAAKADRLLLIEDGRLVTTIGP